MLIVSRKKNESLVIADNVYIRVLDVSGDTVKIGIEAPRNIAVHREEIYRKIQQANLQAASSVLPSETFLKKMK